MVPPEVLELDEPPDPGHAVEESVAATPQAVVSASEPAIRLPATIRRQVRRRRVLEGRGASVMVVNLGIAAGASLSVVCDLPVRRSAMPGLPGRGPSGGPFGPWRRPGVESMVGSMRRRHALWLAPLLLLAGVLAAPPPAQADPGDWTKISTGTVGIGYESSLHRTADGVLHVVYPRGAGSASTYGHTSVRPDGSLANQSTVLSPGWSTLDSAPALIGDGTGLRMVFGGIQTLSSGFWSDGRMYTATAPASGSSWTLPAQAVGISHSAYGSYGTAGVELADGTPVAAFPLSSDITWHVGTGPEADQAFTFGACCVYDLAMVRSGAAVWLAWYANGGTSGTNGVFVKQILPTVGPTTKAPQSSQGASSVSTGTVALAARSGGGIYAAYCVGYPTCDHIGLWRVGSSTVRTVPGSRYAATMSLSPGPSGRLWVAWSDNIPRVRAVRTAVNGATFGAVRTVGMPPHKAAVYDLALDGTTGRGDVVVNVGDGFWHTQVVPGLTLRATPTTWRHGVRRTVTFTVTDAGAAVGAAHVQGGGRSCTTSGSGRCTITFPPSTAKGPITVRVTRSGYAAGAVRLRVT